jgi:hypothetical protein
MRKWIAPVAAAGLSMFFSASAWACYTSDGEITKIDAKASTVVLAAKSCCDGPAEKVSETTFPLKRDTKVLINGKEAKLADLKAGDKAKIDYEKTDDVLSLSVTREG